MIQIIYEFVHDFYSIRMKSVLLFTLAIAVWIVAAGREASGCNVCHSKNPKMVRMHEELGFKDCFKCHGQGMANTPEGKKSQMTSDLRCTPCHKK